MGYPDRHTATHSLRLLTFVADFCASTALAMQESVGMNRQISLASTPDTSSGLQFDGVEKQQKGLRNFLNTDRPQHQSIYRPKNEVADAPPSEVENDQCSTRQTLVLFRGQPWGNC